MGKPAATDRPCLPSLSHSFTLDFIVLIMEQRVKQNPMKEVLRQFLYENVTTYPLNGEDQSHTHQ